VDLAQSATADVGVLTPSRNLREAVFQDEALEVADRIVVMKDGVVQQGTGAALEQDPKVRQAYLGL